MHMNTAGAFKSDMQLSRTWSELWRAICIYFQIICSAGIWIPGLENEKWECFRLTSIICGTEPLKKGEYFLCSEISIMDLKWMGDWWGDMNRPSRVEANGILQESVSWVAVKKVEKVETRREGGQATGLVRTYETCMPPLLFSFSL